MRKLSKGFTLVEIMIVVAIIAILAAVAIPNFVRYRKTSQMNACIANLKQLQTATEQWRMEGPNRVNTNPALTDLCGSTLYIKVTPKCPTTNGDYTPPSNQDAPWKCGYTSDEGFQHVLPGYDASGNAS